VRIGEEYRELNSSIESIRAPTLIDGVNQNVDLLVDLTASSWYDWKALPLMLTSDRRRGFFNPGFIVRPHP